MDKDKMNVEMCKMHIALWNTLDKIAPVSLDKMLLHMGFIIDMDHSMVAILHMYEAQKL